MSLKHSAPLRILHILDHSLPVQSGYAFRSHSILQAQRRRGWESAAVTSPKHYESWRGEPSETSFVGSIRYQRTPLAPSTRLPIAKEFQIMAALAKRLDALVRSEKPDVLHAHSPILNGVCACCGDNQSSGRYKPPSGLAQKSLMWVKQARFWDSTTAGYKSIYDRVLSPTG